MQDELKGQEKFDQFVIEFLRDGYFDVYPWCIRLDYNTVIEQVDGDRIRDKLKCSDLVNYYEHSIRVIINLGKSIFILFDSETSHNVFRTIYIRKISKVLEGEEYVKMSVCSIADHINIAFNASELTFREKFGDDIIIPVITNDDIIGSYEKQQNIKLDSVSESLDKLKNLLKTIAS